MTTRDEAKDLMFAHVQAATPPGVAILWPDTPQDIPSGQTWIRPVVRHASGGQVSLANEVSVRKFKRTGVLVVQLFSPVGDGLLSSDQLAEAFTRYFETIGSSPIWYRNIRAMEVGKDGAAEQVNFMAEFSYEIHH